MKKLSLIFTVVAGMFFCLNAKAQTNIGTQTNAGAQTTADYFAGKWNVIIMGTPNGDSKLTLVFEKKDGKLTGAVRDSTDKEIAKITQIDQKDKSITAAFNVQNYDVTLTLDPVDENNVKGSLLGMFDAKGVRVKESK